MHGYGLSSGRLNVDGVKFVASKLAKFHAASLYLDRDVIFLKTFGEKIDDNFLALHREKTFSIIGMDCLT